MQTDMHRSKLEVSGATCSLVAYSARHLNGYNTAFLHLKYEKWWKGGNKIQRARRALWENMWKQSHQMWNPKDRGADIGSKPSQIFAISSNWIHISIWFAIIIFQIKTTNSPFYKVHNDINRNRLLHITIVKRCTFSSTKRFKDTSAVLKEASH